MTHTARASLLLASLLAPLLAGCYDYNLESKSDDEIGALDSALDSATDTGEIDSGEIDTAEGTLPDSGTPDSGTPDTDTGPDPDAPPPATEQVYLNTSSTLFSFDPATLRATRIGDFSTAGGDTCTYMTDIAIDLDGILYGLCNGILVWIYTTTAVYEEIVASPDSAAVGLTFVSDGTLIVAGSTIYAYDPDIGDFTFLYADSDYATSGDIVGLPDGYLYWSVSGGDDLVRVDPATATATWIGSMGLSDWFPTNVWGLGYADGELFGFTDTDTVLEIDPRTARAVDRGRAYSGAASWYGATTNPVLW